MAQSAARILYLSMLAQPTLRIGESQSLAFLIYDLERRHMRGEVPWRNARLDLKDTQA